MRLGLNLGYRGISIARDTMLVNEAERLGYHSVWTAEAYGSDAVTPLAFLAARTERIVTCSVPQGAPRDRQELKW